jgi:hypothetical protein
MKRALSETRRVIKCYMRKSRERNKINHSTLKNCDSFNFLPSFDAVSSSWALKPIHQIGGYFAVGKKAGVRN